jgi:hypothetical protein
LLLPLWWVQDLVDRGDLKFAPSAIEWGKKKIATIDPNLSTTSH